MDPRFLLALAGLLTVLGAGGAWFAYNYFKRNRQVRDLLALPKNKRKFWFLLRRSGYQVFRYNLFQDVSIVIDGSPRSYSLKADFIASKDNKKFLCLYSTTDEEKELIKLYYIYSQMFQTDGVIFYYDWNQSFSVWANSD